MSLDHVLTDAETPSIDQYLALYRAAGFQVAEQTARHQDGLRNGFVSFGPDYLELVWVENEVQFAEGHPKMPELAERLDRAETQIRRAGLPLVRRQAPETGEPMLLVGPGPRDGFLLALTRYPAGQWAEERRSKTGETFTLAANAAEEPGPS